MLPRPTIAATPRLRRIDAFPVDLKILAVLAMVVLTTVFGSANAQTVSYSGGNLIENFDGMGAFGTNIPAGWFAGWSGPGVTFTTNIAVNSGSIAPNETGGWNFGASGAGDRALGTMATSTGSPVPPGTNRFVEVRIRNSTTTSIAVINVHYDGEEWRTGSSSSQINTNLLQFSADGMNFVSMGPAFQFVQPVLTPTGSALDGNAAANRSTNIGGLYALPAPVPPDGIIYLRWFDRNDPSTDPGLAIDNFSFFVPTNPIVITNQPQTQATLAGSNVTFTVGATGAGLFAYQWKKDGVEVVENGRLTGVTNAVLNISNVQPDDLGIYTVSVSNAGDSTLSDPATLMFIAPPFQWVRQAGSAAGSNAVANGIAMDGATALYVCGSFDWGLDFGSTNVNASAGFGIYLARYSVSGVVEWVRAATSGNSGGATYNVAVDPLGNCYLAGGFAGTTSFGVTNLSSAGPTDGFVAKYDRAGALLWVRQLGGGFDDSARGIAADGTNGCFVTGLLQSASGASSRDIFAAKYDADGLLQWQRQPVGSSSDAGIAAASDAEGNAYITGWFTGTVNFGPTNLTAIGARDIFVAKYNNTGTLLWVASTGGVNGDEGKGVGIDTNGNVYVTGSFNIGGGGTSNAEKFLLTKFSIAGELLWQRELLARFNYLDFSSSTDASGNTWVVAGFPGSGSLNGVPIASGGGYDAIVAKYDSHGTLVWINQVGGLGSAIAHHAALDVAGHCYVTGYFDGNAVFGSTNLTSHGGTNVFVARIGSETPSPLRLAISLTTGVAIELSGAPGSLVQIESVDTLGNGGWTILTNLILPGNTLQWAPVDPPASGTRFYRASLFP